MSFQLGDRVVCIKQDGNVMVGETGTYVHKKNYPPDYGIMWDKRHDDRHTCSHYCEDEHGYYVDEDCIELEVAQDLGDFSANLVPGSVLDLLGG